MITAEGKLSDVKATAATGSSFETAAVEAARKFELDPAKRDSASRTVPGLCTRTE